MKNASYSAIGGVFEYLNSDCDYSQWSQYLIKTLAAENAGRRGVDIGCGNGYFTRALYKAGYSVVGMDNSPCALSAAVELARKEGVGAEFLAGDITKLHLCGKGGLFVFDISSEYKLKNTVGNNTFVKDYENATLVWLNTLLKDRVEMDLILFTRNENGTYTRSDESQTQYIYAESEISAALEGAGFAVRTEGHLGGSKEQRINFICKKL